MRRRNAGSLVLIAAAGIGLAACGSSTSTVTLQVNTSAGSLDVVVTGDQNTISQIQGGMNQAIASGETSGAAVQTVQGDQHTGNQVCSTNVSSNGVSAQLTVYSTISGIDSSICSTLQSDAQSAGS
jgi:hypothetical protein